MRAMFTLKLKAKTYAHKRGHVLAPFVTSSHRTATATCSELNCTAYVTVNSAPAPNEIAIGGTAVALYCPSAERS